MKTKNKIKTTNILKGIVRALVIIVWATNAKQEAIIMRLKTHFLSYSVKRIKKQVYRETELKSNK